MRSMQTFLLAGAAALAVGLPGTASAQSRQTHVMTIALPSGGAAEIRYTGSVPPQVSVSDAPAPFDAWMPAALLLGPDSPFAMMQRISAEMDRQAAAMFRDAAAVAAHARSGEPVATAFGRLPPGSSEYTSVSTMSGNGVCTQSVEITSPGNGAPPHVVSHSSGNCGSASGGPGGTVNLPVAPSGPAQRPDLVLTRNSGAAPYAGLVHEAAAVSRQ